MEIKNKAEAPSDPPAIQLLKNNRQSLIDKFGFSEALYTPPSPDHYPHIYFWDSAFSAIIFARHGYSREAITELFSLVEHQRPDGFIANMQFAPAGRQFDIERPSFMNRAKESDYGQPPILALSVAETVAALEAQGEDAQLFLSEMYPHLRNFYNYLENTRQNSIDDPLLGVIHPHETGRDSDPTFDFFKLRLRRQGKETSKLIDEVNRVTDYASVILLNYRLRFKKWDVGEARKLFWVNDVMFNCLYIDNLLEMAALSEKVGQAEDSANYAALAGRVEDQILDKMWFPEARDGRGAFLALNKDGQPIKEISVSNLFPLLLPNLKEEQLASLLDLIADSFDTKYPLPSIATDSPNYDPANQERDRLWRGPTWTNTNWYLMERGLRMQAERPDLAHRADLTNQCLYYAAKIAASSKALVENGQFEFNNPETGQPQRTKRVRDFAWPGVATMPERQRPAEDYKLAA